jgi:kinetochore protein Mis13/DSN1
MGIPRDPQDVLRALAMVDAERPPAQVGDAARRAVREVQRVNETGVGPVSERRLTGVPPPTPRKTPGTPRKTATPGRNR